MKSYLIKLSFLILMVQGAYSSGPGDWSYCSISNPCLAGYGDCDSDSECQSGLICKQDVGANYGWSSSVDVCEAPTTKPGDWDYCSSSKPCSAGYGDCDSDSECQSGLICKQDVGANYGWNSSVDVCEAPTLPTSSPGDWDYCSSSKPCSAGYGDCDSDSECQSGLICKQDVGANYGWSSSVDVCEAQTLSAPTLITPYNGIGNISTTSDTVFRWNSVNGATVYRIVISQDSSFSGFVDKGASSYCLGTCLTYRTSSTNYTKHGFNLSGHTYYWKVRAGNANSGSLWSNTYRLTTAGNSLLSGGDLSFPSSGSGWSHTAGSSFHRLISYAGYNFDDTYALDLNLNVPYYNYDSGKEVRPIADGKIIIRYSPLGFVLIKHDTPIKLDNGQKLDVWYSGYMHMSNITSSTNVNTTMKIGNISSQSATNDHLHFAVYTLVGNRYVSIDVANNLKKFVSPISYWYDQCTSSTIYYSYPWWNLGETPCK